MTRDRETLSNGLDKSGNNTSGPGYYIFYTEPNKQTKVIQFYTDTITSFIKKGTTYFQKSSVIICRNKSHLFVLFTNDLHTLFTT